MVASAVICGVGRFRRRPLAVLRRVPLRWLRSAEAGSDGHHLNRSALRGFAQASQDTGRIVGPRHYPSLSQTLRNTRGRELLRIVDTAVPNLKHIKEFSVILKALAIDGQW